MKMIRWSGLVAFVLIVGLIAMFNLLFLDGIIKNIVENQASLAVGARVDIGNLTFNLFGLSLDIHDLQVANPEQPMRNAVEVGSLAFDLAAPPLLKKKIVIQRMKAVDLAWDTARQTSGALPAPLRKKRKTLEKPMDIGATTETRFNDCVLPDFSALAKFERNSFEYLLADTTLPSASFIADYRKKISSVKALWEKRLADLPMPEELSQDLKALQNLTKERPTDVTQLSAYLEKVKTLQQKQKGAWNGLAAAKRDFQTEINSLKVSLKEVEKIKDHDLKTVMAKLGLEMPSAENLVCVLLGKEMVRKVNGAIAWYRKLNRFMPAGTPKEKPRPETTPRLKGADVRFPFTGGCPDFLLEVAEFSARPKVEETSGGLAFARLAGELQGLTPQPALYDKPTVFRLKGALIGERAREMTLFGKLDHRWVPADDQIDLIIKDLRLERPNEAGSEQSPLWLASARLDVDASLRIQGENLEGRALVSLHQPKVKVGSEAEILADVFSDLGAFDVTLSIGGTVNQPALGLTSSATMTLSMALEKTIQTKLEEMRPDLKEAIDARIDRDLLTVGQEVDTFEKSILGEISSRLDLAAMVPQKDPGKKNPAARLKEKVLPFLK